MSFFLIVGICIVSCKKDKDESNNGGGTLDAPNIPTGVAAEQSGSEVYIYWDAVSNATSYKVYRITSESYHQIGSSSKDECWFYDKNPLNGNNCYAIKAVNDAGESDYSDYAYCDFSGGSGSTDAQVRFENVNGGYPFGLSVNYGSGSATYEQWGSDPWLSDYFTIPAGDHAIYSYSPGPWGDSWEYERNYNFEANKKYKVRYSSSLEVINEGGGGGGGDKPDTPTGLSASQSGSSIVISWNNSTGATRYKVYKSSSASGTYTEIGSPSSTSYTDNNPITGYNYYKVSAINNTGESPQSDYVSCNFSSGGGDAPNTPTGLSATQSGSSIVISWNSSTGATSYKVYRSSSASGTYSQIGSPSGTSYTDNSPISGYNYYKVSAVNSYGESNQSSYVSCNFSGGGGGEKPDTPTGLSASQSGYGVAISWNSSTSATSYKVYRSSSASGTYTVIGSPSGTSYADSNPIIGDNYYKVSAVNSYGESPQSSYVSCNFNFAPCPPIYGNCTVSGTTMTMRWTVSTSSGCGKPTEAILRVRAPISGTYIDVEFLSGTTTSVSFNYTPWVDSQGYVFVGILLKNEKGSSGGVPKVWDDINKKWIN